MAPQDQEETLLYVWSQTRSFRLGYLSVHLTTPDDVGVWDRSSFFDKGCANPGRHSRLCRGANRLSQ